MFRKRKATATSSREKQHDAIYSHVMSRSGYKGVGVYFHGITISCLLKMRKRSYSVLNWKSNWMETAMNAKRFTSQLDS